MDAKDMKPISKQTQYQRRHKAAGLCVQCCEPIVKGSKAFCVKHLLDNRRRSHIYYRTMSGVAINRPTRTTKPRIPT